MNEPLPPLSKTRKRTRKVARKAAHMTAREYLPMAMTIGFWAVAALSAGHADTARLLSATVVLRAIVMLVELTTIGPLRMRDGASVAVRRKSKRNAALMQLGALSAAAVLIGGVSLALVAAGQDKIAEYLPLVALGLPVRAYRGVETRTSSRYMRLAVSSCTLIGALAAWAVGAGVLGIAFAYGARDWIATGLVRLWPIGRIESGRTIDEPLRFAEVARNTVVTSRRLLTYRLTKNLLAIFGPFGNFAARTGRGLNWHSKLEPYMPHRLSGFILFALVTGGGAVFLAIRSGEPAAMVAGAGLLQLCAIALNVLILWRYLPRRDDPNLVIEEDEDD